MPKFRIWLPCRPTPGHHYIIREAPDFDTLRKKWTDAIRTIRSKRKDDAEPPPDSKGEQP